MKPCSLWECYRKRASLKRDGVATLASFLTRCNSCCHKHESSRYRSETNRMIRHAYAEWYMEGLRS